MVTTPFDLDAIKHLSRPWTSEEEADLLIEVERLRAESVPRSALVQVGRRHPEGWVCTDDRWSWCRTKSCGDQPVYVIRRGHRWLKP